MSKESIKKYVGATGDALVYIWQKLRGVNEPEKEPPVGSQDKFGGRATPAVAAVGGIPTGMLLMIALLWMLMKRR